MNISVSSIEQRRLEKRITKLSETAFFLKHELNQPLTAVISYCATATTLLKDEKADVLMLTQLLEKASMQAYRASLLSKKMNELMVNHVCQHQHINIIDSAYKAKVLFESELPDLSIPISIESDLLVLNVLADPILIEIVILNLLRNAVQAIENNEKKLFFKPVLILKIIQINKEVHISVFDNGPGIKNVVKKNVFEAFFSTKKKGMGIGLYLCHLIIQKHQGHLWFENILNKKGLIEGCCFHFSLGISETNEVCNEN